MKNHRHIEDNYTFIDLNMQKPINHILIYIYFWNTEQVFFSFNYSSWKIHLYKAYTIYARVYYQLITDFKQYCSIKTLLEYAFTWTLKQEAKIL